MLSIKQYYDYRKGVGFVAGMLILCVTAGSGCTSSVKPAMSDGHSGSAGAQQLPPGFGVPNNAPDDAQIIAAQNGHWKRVEVTVTAPVYKLLRDADYREPHQRFLLSLSNGTTVLVENDIKYGTFVPAHAGDILRLHGEYIWTERGGILHWTHRSDEPNHEGGWIDLNGVRYQ